MIHTVDSLMELALNWRLAGSASRDKHESILHTALTEALAQPHIDCGWVTAADQEMIGAHLGVANLSDSHESATAKLRQLIGWHIAVATYPAVNGGLSLQPVREPLTYEQIGMAWLETSDPVGLGGKFKDAKHVREFARAIESAHGIGGDK